MLTDDLKEKFLNIAGALSPENLTCDGELPPDAVRRKERRLREEWAALEKQAGRAVTEDEIWGWCINRRRS